MEGVSSDYIEADLHQLYTELSGFVTLLHETLCGNRNPADYAHLHFQSCLKYATEDLHNKADKRVWQTLGFSIKRDHSRIKEAGLGVIVSEGRIEANKLVALYPGKKFDDSVPCLAMFEKIKYLKTYMSQLL